MLSFQGHPFMESIRENRPLMISLVGTYSFIVFLALGWSSDLCEQFGIVQFPEEVSCEVGFPPDKGIFLSTLKIFVGLH